MSKQKFVYVTYIRTSPDELWDALLSGPHSQDNKRSSLRWCPVAQLTGAAPILSVVLRSTNLSTILAPPPLAVR